MLNKRILVKSVTNLSEARYCAGMFVDFISFELNENNPYYIPKKNFDEIRGWLSGVKILGSFEGGDTEQINEKIKEYDLDGFILAEDQADHLAAVHVPLIIQEYSQTPLPFLPQDTILLWTGKGLPTEKTNAEILLGFDFKRVTEKNLDADGYAFLGSFEKQVGENSYDELMEALEYIEENYW